jgi:hypothetical protein
MKLAAQKLLNSGEATLRAGIFGTRLPVQPSALRGSSQIAVRWWGRRGRLRRSSNLGAGGLKTCHAKFVCAERGATMVRQQK